LLRDAKGGAGHAGRRCQGLVDLHIGVFIGTELDLEPVVGSIDDLGPAVDIHLVTDIRTQLRVNQ